MGRPKKVKEEEVPVLVEENVNIETAPKKRKYTKKETKKKEVVADLPKEVVAELPKKDEDVVLTVLSNTCQEESEIDLIKEVETINMDDFKIHEEEIRKAENKEEKMIKMEKRWEELDYKSILVNEKREEEKIYKKEDWNGNKINIYIYHTDISKNKIVTEEMMNERKFLYQIFIYGREGNDCIINGEERLDLEIQKTYLFNEDVQIHLLNDLPPINEINKEKWRQYILFYKMELKEMSEMMKLQRLMRKDLWFYEKYGNLIKMTIDNTYVLEREIYIRNDGKKYSFGVKVKDILEKMIE